MAGLLTDLSVAGKLLFRQLGKTRSAAPDLDRFSADLQSCLERLDDGLVAETACFDMPANKIPWCGSGVRLQAGEELSYFLCGQVCANRSLDIQVNPALNTWCKIGEQGNVFRGTRLSHSVRATEEGELLFGNYFPNDWTTPRGERMQDDSVYNSVSGEVRILVIRWKGTALEGLQALAAVAAPDSLVHNE